ncbi:MAG: DNA translocase FtsK [Lachnospiraceae bacterium]|nr:DNA translocase FtsK [Lachnospiraceae bacterium]
MATRNNGKNSNSTRTSTRKSSGSGTGRSSRRTSSQGAASRQSSSLDPGVSNEITLIIVLALCVFLFLCNFGIIGTFGNFISSVQFGIFGFPAFVMPIGLFVLIGFLTVNPHNGTVIRKSIAGGVLFLIFGIICEMISGHLSQLASPAFDVREFYRFSADNHSGGGVLGGSLAFLMTTSLSMAGTVLLLIVIALICIILLTERELFYSLKDRVAERFEDTSGDEEYQAQRREDRILRKQQREERRQALREKRQEEEERRRALQEERELARKQKEEEREQRRQEELEAMEDERILRKDKKVSGVMLDTSLDATTEKTRDDIHEIVLDDSYTEEATEPAQDVPHYGYHMEEEQSDITEIMGDFTGDQVTLEEYAQDIDQPELSRQLHVEDKPARTTTRRSAVPKEPVKRETPAARPAPKVSHDGAYHLPPTSLLVPGKGKKNTDSAKELQDTAEQLRSTLETFGVNVTITDISQGPAVTRYEFKPEQGVKVSKIVGLADDIKLNLAATDIRIEAPIPGKAAVGIEIPNKENSMVAFRDLVESREYKEFDSKLAFAVGKDIAGKTVVTDLAKMPHLLIAGATGSGKSVCINTIIMSLLYKANPDEVKMIMIDPKVVELSVYNGIPHLLIPVVTDPKQASAALQWGVTQMSQRYKIFADNNVRDIKGYNKMVESKLAAGEEVEGGKLPQIVIIVDELADLMMVASNEVETAICRLAQLARAAGIHLIIATQRPSVDVITGLIKANMPSRIAFAVSSGVDSRTILDMVGAEKLLGKGDMLFFPQGYTKPARVQGAFVSDKEVQDVVEYVKSQASDEVYANEIAEQIKNASEAMAAAGGDVSGGGENDLDEKFIEVGRLLVKSERPASVGNLQRVFKIGFNRAARIMDQLAEAGVVSEAEGTKPRRVLMTPEEFENYIEENGL